MNKARFDWIMKCMAFEKKTPREKAFLQVCDNRMKRNGDLPEEMEEILEDIFKRKGDTGSPIVAVRADETRRREDARD